MFLNHIKLINLITPTGQFILHEKKKIPGLHPTLIFSFKIQNKEHFDNFLKGDTLLFVYEGVVLLCYYSFIVTKKKNRVSRDNFSTILPKSKA